MGRMQAPRQGPSQWALPRYHHSAPTWLKLTSDDAKGANLQIGQGGPDSLTSRRDTERRPWCCPSTFCDRQ
uniref:Ribosomal protein S13/S15 N-terminal domain-containing protein n=1 Tax=Ursus americanus TaxID=9643 RepID=A0A452S8H2_URSAM